VNGHEIRFADYHSSRAPRRLRRRPRHPGYRGREHPRAGQTLVAAAPGAAGASGSDQGAACVFTNTGGTWTQIAELTVPGTAELGTSLAISTDASTIVLGSPTSNDDNGEAFVFTKSGSTYVQTEAHAHAHAHAGRPRLLGDNTAISSNGSTIAFGEPNVGVTDVFTRAAGASTWTQTAQLNGGGDSVAVSSNGEIVAAGQTRHQRPQRRRVRVHRVRRHLH
jgi:hypothetical protein